MAEIKVWTPQEIATGVVSKVQTVHHGDPFIRLSDHEAALAACAASEAPDGSAALGRIAQKAKEVVDACDAIGNEGAVPVPRVRGWAEAIHGVAVAGLRTDA